MAEFNWRLIGSAPRDGTRILARAKNSAGHWTDPVVVWWDDGWQCGPDEDGHPLIIYHPLLEWVSVTWPDPPNYWVYNNAIS
jgi:hypothetical protein